MKLLFITQQLRNILEKAFVKGHYRTNPKTKEPYWVDDYYDKRKLKHVESVAPKQKKRVNKSEQELSHKKKQLESELAYLDIHEHEAISSHGSKYKKDKLHGKDYYAGHSLDEVRNNFRIQRAKLENEMKQIEEDLKVVKNKKGKSAVEKKIVKPDDLLIEKLEQIGTKWISKTGEKRIYFDLLKLYGLEIEYKDNGKIDFAWYKGRSVSKNEARILLDMFNSSESSLYFDTKSGKFISYGISDMDDLVDTVISMVGKSVYDSAMVEYNKRLPQQYPLPGMTGTSRQVNWAVDIRNKIIEKINAAEMDVHDIAEKAAIKDIKKETRASWWIENRESEIKDMIAAKVEYTENTLPELVGEDDKKKRAAEIRERMRNSIMDRIKKLNIVDNTMLDDFVHKKAYYYLRETGADEWINREKNNHVDIEQILGIAKNPQRRRF